MGRDTPEITIVSGLPRSGTSMMMAMLHAGGLPALTDHARAADEDNRRGYWEFEPVRTLRTDAAWLPGARAHAVKIIAPLLQHLPDTEQYALLLMRRDLDEVLASQRTMLARRARPGGRLTDDQFRTLFRQQLDHARAWAARTGARLLEVDYNALLADPAPHVARIAGFLDRHLDVEAMIATVEPTLYRQRAGAEPTGDAHD